MIARRPSGERGRTEIEWLDSRHTFSFADYSDPGHEEFRSLRVINEDFIAPGGGFPPHPHRDMEIVTVVLEGALQHRDSLGNGSVIRPGDVQRMSAGTGVVHSEFNASKKDPLHLFQIWLRPDRQGLRPGYEQKAFPDAPGLWLVASRDGRDGSVTIHQDAALHRGRLEAGGQAMHRLGQRHAWVQVARGALKVNGQELSQGDGASVSGERELAIRAEGPAEFLLFDLA